MFGFQASILLKCGIAPISVTMPFVGLGLDRQTCLLLPQLPIVDLAVVVREEAMFVTKRLIAFTLE